MSRFGWLCHGATAAVTAAIGFRATTRRAHTVGLAGVQWDLARCTTTMGLGGKGSKDCAEKKPFADYRLI